MTRPAARSTIRKPTFFLAGVLLAACAQGGATTTSVEPTTSSTEASTTSVTSTTTPTTTTPSGVSVHHLLPRDVFGPSDVPWSEVGPGWYLVLYDASRLMVAEVREGPSVLYLVSPNGDLYEMAAWAPGEFPTLLDATTTKALVTRWVDSDVTAYEVIDLKTGAVTTVYTPDPEDSLFVNVWPNASLTRPNGDNVVVFRSDGNIDWIERRSPDGQILSVVLEQPSAESHGQMSWLYAPDGTSLVVGAADRLFHVSNQGELLGELWVPRDSRCEPVRWWEENLLVAVCYGNGPGSAPLDDTGQPHTYYGRLWLVGLDGDAGTALSEFPDEPPIVVDFGYRDAWPVDDGVLLQWRGDCGSAAIARSPGDFLRVDDPEGRLVHGAELVDVIDGRITAYIWDSCDQGTGGLLTFAPDGNYSGTLIRGIGDARGVTSVAGLATVHP